MFNIFVLTTIVTMIVAALNNPFIAGHVNMSYIIVSHLLCAISVAGMYVADQLGF